MRYWSTSCQVSDDSISCKQSLDVSCENFWVERIVDVSEKTSDSINKKLVSPMGFKENHPKEGWKPKVHRMLCEIVDDKKNYLAFIFCIRL